MTCARVRHRLSAWIDGELDREAAVAVQAHLASCAGCARVATELRAVSALLGELPRLEAGESVSAGVLDRLEIEAGTGRPGLAFLFRGFGAARPFMLPSFVPAALLLMAILAGALALDTGPLPEVHLAPGAWGAIPASGTEGNPLLPSAGVGLPRETEALAPEILAAGGGEGSLFLETVVARDGSVAGVTVLYGSAEGEAALLEALRRQRYEPARFEGRPVAVSLYRLISRMEVRSPLT